MNLVSVQEFRNEGDARELALKMRQFFMLSGVKGEAKVAHRGPTPAEQKRGKFGGKWMVTQYREAA